jgi:hypothetical protein
LGILDLDRLPLVLHDLDRWVRIAARPLVKLLGDLCVGRQLAARDGLKKLGKTRLPGVPARSDVPPSLAAPQSPKDRSESAAPNPRNTQFFNTIRRFQPFIATAEPRTRKAHGDNLGTDLS